jgi:chemotaxis protein CheD
LNISGKTEFDNSHGPTAQTGHEQPVAGDRGYRACSTPIEVPTGALLAARGGRLRASAIGSCVVLALVDPASGIGGLAHVMLPGEAPLRQNVQRSKYAKNGIRELAKTMTDFGARPDGLVACIAGGGNVLERPHDTLCEENIHSVVHTLAGLGIALLAQDVGGVLRRSLTFDIDTGEVILTVGDGGPALLWHFNFHDPKRG